MLRLASGRVVAYDLFWDEFEAVVWYHDVTLDLLMQER